MELLTYYAIFASSIAIWAHLYIVSPAVKELVEEEAEIVNHWLKRIGCYLFSFLGNLIIAPIMLIVIFGANYKLDRMREAFKSGLSEN